MWVVPGLRQLLDRLREHYRPRQSAILYENTLKCSNILYCANSTDKLAPPMKATSQLSCELRSWFCFSKKNKGSIRRPERKMTWKIEKASHRTYLYRPMQPVTTRNRVPVIQIFFWACDSSLAYEQDCKRVLSKHWSPRSNEEKTKSDIQSNNRGSWFSDRWSNELLGYVSAHSKTIASPNLTFSMQSVRISRWMNWRLRIVSP